MYVCISTSVLSCKAAVMPTLKRAAGELSGRVLIRFLTCTKLAQFKL